MFFLVITFLFICFTTLYTKLALYLIPGILSPIQYSPKIVDLVKGDNFPIKWEPHLQSL